MVKVVKVVCVAFSVLSVDSRLLAAKEGKSDLVFQGVVAGDGANEGVEEAQLTWGPAQLLQECRSGRKPGLRSSWPRMVPSGTFTGWAASGNTLPFSGSQFPIVHTGSENAHL